MAAVTAYACLELKVQVALRACFGTDVGIIVRVSWHRDAAADMKMPCQQACGSSGTVQVSVIWCFRQVKMLMCVCAFCRQACQHCLLFSVSAADSGDLVVHLAEQPFAAATMLEAAVRMCRPDPNYSPAAAAAPQRTCRLNLLQHVLWTTQDCCINSPQGSRHASRAPLMTALTRHAHDEVWEALNSPESALALKAAHASPGNEASAAAAVEASTQAALAAARRDSSRCSCGWRR
jgi:hypothetical protein